METILFYCSITAIIFYFIGKKCNRELKDIKSIINNNDIFVLKDNGNTKIIKLEISNALYKDIVSNCAKLKTNPKQIILNQLSINDK